MAFYFGSLCEAPTHVTKLKHIIEISAVLVTRRRDLRILPSTKDTDESWVVS